MCDTAQKYVSILFVEELVSRLRSSPLYSNIIRDYFWLLTLSVGGPRLTRPIFSIFEKGSACCRVISSFFRWLPDWVVGCWHGYLCGVRCRLAYGPADATVCCFSKIQIGFTFLVPAHPGHPGCVCVVCTRLSEICFTPPQKKSLLHSAWHFRWFWHSADWL